MQRRGTRGVLGRFALRVVKNTYDTYIHTCFRLQYTCALHLKRTGNKLERATLHPTRIEGHSSWPVCVTTIRKKQLNKEKKTQEFPKEPACRCLYYTVSCNTMLLAGVVLGNKRGKDLQRVDRTRSSFLPSRCKAHTYRPLDLPWRRGRRCPCLRCSCSPPCLPKRDCLFAMSSECLEPAPHASHKQHSVSESVSHTNIEGFALGRGALRAVSAFVPMHSLQEWLFSSEFKEGAESGKAYADASTFGARECT